MKLGPIVPIKRPLKACYLDDWSTLKPEELAQAVAKNNGGNFGLRLDHYASLDPDSTAARTLCEQWEKEGILTPTVAWRTASGAIRRLYIAPPGLARMQIDAIKFDLRHGSGFQDVIPPSFVDDPKKGIRGRYAWLPDQDPDSIEVAPLPEFVVEYFKKHSDSSITLNAFHKDTTSKDDAKWLSLWQGVSTGSLHDATIQLAGRLLGRGLPEEEVIEILRIWNTRNDPPSDEKMLIKRVRGIEKKELRKQAGVAENLTDEVRKWVSVTPGDFSVTFCYSDLGCVTSGDKATVRKALERMVTEGLVVHITGRKGMYRPVVADMTRIKLKEANTQGAEIDIHYPFGLEQWYKTFAKTVAVVAGCPDSGKTAWLLDFVYKNLGREDIPPIHYFTSEMGADEFYDRASNLSGFNPEYWDKHLAIWERSEVFEDVVQPDAINIIDYLDLQEDFYEVGKFIHRIWAKLRKGIAIIALQKDSKKDWGKGGVGSAERARLYLSLEPGTPNIMKVLKIKNWRNRMQGIKGKEFKFKLINGCTFKQVEDRANPLTEGNDYSQRY